MEPPTDEDIPELRRKIETTSKVRFFTYNRLLQHERYSQWSLSLYSLILIASGLGDFVQTTEGSPYFRATQVLLSVAVLILSLLIGRERFGVEAERMHRCGIELMYLSRSRLDPSKREGKRSSIYDQLLFDYRAILEKYANHHSIDYLSFKTTHPAGYYEAARSRLLLDRAHVMLQRSLRFLVYFLPPTALAAVLLWFFSA